MAGDNRIDLLELLRKAGHDGDIDFLAEAVRVMAQVLMELDVRQKVGAAPYERSAARQTYRNGYRTRLWDTRVGRIELRIPKLRQGSYFPAILEPRRRAEQALVSVIQEAYVHGVSTRKVDELVQAMGLEGVSKSEVSRLCAELDQMVEVFRNRPLGCFPYVWLDATYLKVREDGRVQSMALVVATGVKDTGEREVLGLDVGPSEDGAFWMAFLRGLLARGLEGVKLVISDAHEGLKAAIDAVLQGASWQRCRVHFMRNVLAQVPKSAQPMVAAAVRTIFTQATQDEARAQLRHVADTLEARFPKLARLLLDAEDEVLAYMVFPERHWRQIHSTNPLERLHKEIKRRAHVVGIFPNRASVLRLMGAVLMEQNDEWATGRRYFSADSMAEIGRREANTFIAAAAD